MFACIEKKNPFYSLTSCKHTKFHSFALPAAVTLTGKTSGYRKKRKQHVHHAYTRMKALVKLQAMLPEKKKAILFPCSLNYFLPATPPITRRYREGGTMRRPWQFVHFRWRVLFETRRKKKRRSISYRGLSAGVPNGPFKNIQR